MNLPDRIRTMDKRLRVMVIATAILVVPQIGQILSIADINASGHADNLAIFFVALGIFTVPTSLILTAAILSGIRQDWRRHERLVLLGALNLLIALNIIWFFAAQCSWSQLVGIAIATCSK